MPAQLQRSWGVRSHRRFQLRRRNPMSSAVDSDSTKIFNQGKLTGRFVMPIFPPPVCQFVQCTYNSPHQHGRLILFQHSDPWWRERKRSVKGGNALTMSHMRGELFWRIRWLSPIPPHPYLFFFVPPVSWWKTCTLSSFFCCCLFVCSFSRDQC